MNFIKRNSIATITTILMGLSFQVTNVKAQALDVPSDPTAQYIVIQKSKGNGMAIIQTLRSGTSGVSFASRLIDCQQATYKYLATEDDINLYVEKHNKALKTLNKNNMGKLTQQSISSYIAVEACK